MATEAEAIVKVESWVLCLIDFESKEPSFYYNPINESFERKFSNQCAYLSREQCEVKESELNIVGLEIVKGTMDVPRDLLIESIIETFDELGLIKNIDK
ncbi:hypothetical protein AB1K09_06340 [Solibacillus silvestris]